MRSLLRPWRAMIIALADFLHKIVSNRYYTRPDFSESILVLSRY